MHRAGRKGESQRYEGNAARSARDGVCARCVRPERTAGRRARACCTHSGRARHAAAGSLDAGQGEVRRRIADQPVPRHARRGNAFFDVPMRLTWSATDNTDSELNYDVWEYPQGARPNRIGNFITETTFDVVGSDYDGFFGGAPNVIDRWGVQAYDNAGNSTARTIFGAHLFVFGRTIPRCTPSARRRRRRSRASATSAPGPSPTALATPTRRPITPTSRTSRSRDVTVARGEEVSRVALVMDQGPGHGRARIVVDGRARAPSTRSRRTRSTEASSGRTSLRPGAHTIRIVNLATQGALGSTSTPSSSTDGVRARSTSGRRRVRASRRGSSAAGVA